MPPPFRCRTTKTEPRRSPQPALALEERIEQIMDRVHQAGDNLVERVAALQEYLTLARGHEGETWFDAGAWSEDLADSYLALGRVEDGVRTISDATRSGHAEGAKMLCELAEKLMRSGYEPQARLLWQQARAGHPDDVRIYVQAGIGYGDIGDHAGALEWLSTGLELAVRTGDPESALGQLRPLRASCLPALGRPPDEIQGRPVQLPSRQLRDAAGVLSGLRGRTRVRCDERLRKARHRATHCRTPRPHARVERHAALSPRSTRSSLGHANVRRPAPSSCPGTSARRSAASAGLRRGTCNRAAGGGLPWAGECECRPAGLRGGRHEDQPWPIRTTNGSARARR